MSQFQPHQSGNPDGRPTGSIHRFDQRFADFARDVYQRAQAGDIQAQELILRAVIAQSAPSR